MLNKIITIVMLAILVLTICFFRLYNSIRSDLIWRVDAPSRVVIERLMRGVPDPGIRIACEKASADIVKRLVIIEGLISFKGYNASQSWTVSKMKVRDSKLFIEIPKDKTYSVAINGTVHSFPLKGKV